MLLPESLGQTIEVQFCLTSKLSGICPAYTPTKRGIPFDEWFAPVILGLPVMPLFLPVSLVTMWMKSWEERCTHIREAGATKTFLFQINLALSYSSIWVILCV